MPPDYHNEVLNDSKQLTPHQRYALREVIERDAVAWAVGVATVEEIDRINILNAAILAMHRAIEALKVKPQFLIIDGNRFKPVGFIPYTTIVKGDAKYLSIAAASVLAKPIAMTIWPEWLRPIPDMAGKVMPAIPPRRIARPSETWASRPCTAAPSAFCPTFEPWFY